MEVQSKEANKKTSKKSPTKLNLKKLRLSLKYRPEILQLILKLKQNLKKKTQLIKQMQQNLKKFEKYLKEKNSVPTTEANIKDSSTQTEDNLSENSDREIPKKEIQSMDTETLWKIDNDSEGKSIADQVKEAAQSALQQSGMVYVESAGMYYDYKTGYYYNSELGLYYHTDTGCYYSYSEDKKEFAFHSYPDQRAVAANASWIAHEKRKARKHKKDKEEEPKPKKKKKSKKESPGDKKESPEDKKESPEDKKESPEDKKESLEDKKEQIDGADKVEKETENGEKEKEEIEDGECSETESEKESEHSSDEESNASTSTASDDDSVAKHHPPCMRIIVRETSLSKLKVGSLFLVTKDGGTIGREGNNHTILLKDHNVSRNHLDIKYDMDRRMYMATDLGSKNGTLLNGIQMSQSLVVSQPLEIVHGSTLQLGETKLLCHIHPGNDTCGHCEPGLIMETQEKEKTAYTRTCSVQKQHQLELARLKNKYAPEPLMIEDGTYNDRAKARRETVGSSHHSEKTEITDMDTSIAPENKGFKLLEKMGWSKGEGLGKDNQGETEPIPLVSNEGKAGLGTPGSVAPPQQAPPKRRNKLGEGTLRLMARSKLLQPPAKAFQNEEEGDDDE